MRLQSAIGLSSRNIGPHLQILQHGTLPLDGLQRLYHRQLVPILILLFLQLQSLL